MILGVSWCLPCLTIAKGAGGFPPAATTFPNRTVHPSGREQRKKLCNVQSNSSLFPNVIPPCTTLIDTTFNASNTLLKLAILQKRNGSDKSESMTSNFSKSTRFSVSLPLHISDSQTCGKGHVNEIKTCTKKLGDTTLSPKRVDKQCQRAVNLDSIIKKSSTSVGQHCDLDISEKTKNLKSMPLTKINPTCNTEQKSTAVVRPCLRHRRSSYDDILRRSSEKCVNSYSSLDKKNLNSRTTKTTNTMPSSLENINPLNKSVKFILPETNTHEMRQGYNDAAMTAFNSNINVDHQISPSIFPLVGISSLPYECMIQHHDYYSAFCNNNPNAFPYTPYVPSIKEGSYNINSNQSFIFSSPMDVTPVSKFNVSVPDAPFIRNSIQPSLSLINPNIKKENIVTAYENYNEKSYTQRAENNIFSTGYGTERYIHGPTAYYPTMTTSSTFCTTCCWDCHKNGLPMFSYHSEQKSSDGSVPFSKNAFLTDDKNTKQRIDYSSNNLKHTFSDNEEDDGSDSNEDDTEGDLDYACNLY